MPLSSSETEELFRRDEEVVAMVTNSLMKHGHPICGSDNEGGEYKGIEDMWRSLGILPNDSTTTRDNDNDSDSSESSWYWYEQSGDYWEDEDNCEATVQGMLGGFAKITAIDLQGSKEFLEEVGNMRHPDLVFEESTVCDCGAGIGRITEGLLLPLKFQSIHLIEGSARLLDVAKVNLKQDNDNTTSITFVNQTLQDYVPDTQFHVIWIQWVIGYLTDRDCVDFLRRCGKSLIQPNGILCIKDNTSGTDEAFQLDRNDSSITRSLPYLQNLAAQAGLRQIHLKMQSDFPEEIFPVPMIAFEYVVET